MKLLFTGAGGGHFYPLIAVAEAIRAEVFIEKVADPEMYFMSDDIYDEAALKSVRMSFISIPAGKMRVYSSFENVTDLFRIAWGCLVALQKLFILYPDVIFAKGGYSSFPVLFAARILGIPVIIHESDSVPGRVTKWAGGFADRVALSQEEVAGFFPKERVALTGQPIRMNLLPPLDFERTKAPDERPTILVLGGSQGSSRINEFIVQALPELLKTFDVVHQTGTAHEDAVGLLIDALLKDHEFKDRYYSSGFLDLSLYYPKVDFAISRAGSTTLFEEALWQIPSVVIPIPRTISRDQTSNAYAFAKKGTCIVIEENNLSANLLVTELKLLYENKERYSAMAKAGKALSASRDAAHVIAREMIAIGRSHL